MQDCVTRFNIPSTDADNQGAVFNLQTQQLEFLGQNGFGESARRLHKLDFGPRLGIAYRFDDKTVVRAGYGVSLDRAGRHHHSFHDSAVSVYPGSLSTHAR